MIDIKMIEEEAERMKAEAERKLLESNRLHNEANAIKIDRALKKRLSPLHYKLITKVRERDIIELELSEDCYLVGQEEDRKISLRIIKGEQLGTQPHKSLHGTGYPRKSLVGYYSGFVTPEFGGCGDSVFLNSGKPDEGRYMLAGLIGVPLETIVSYSLR